jgi:hypothetical protein
VIDIWKLAEDYANLLQEGASPSAVIRGAMLRKPRDEELVPSPVWQKLVVGYLAVVAELLRRAEDLPLIKLLNEVRSRTWVGVRRRRPLAGVGKRICYRDIHDLSLG